MSDDVDRGEQSGVPLSEMIETLRRELQQSVNRGKGQAVAFEIDKVELELKVAISRKTEVEGGVAFWVVKAGGAIEAQRDTVHNFKLTLAPVAAVSGARLKLDTETAEAPQGN